MKLYVNNGKLELKNQDYKNKLEVQKVCNFIINRYNEFSAYCLEQLKQFNFIKVKAFQEIINNTFREAGIYENIPNLYKEYHANWMKFLPQNAKDSLITKLTLPATHDSAAYKVDFSAEISEYNQLGKSILYYVDKMPSFVGSIIKNFISNWTITQHSTIKEQLEGGIRYLDLRVAYNQKEDKFYGAHTFLTENFNNIANDIADFMKEHPEEVVIVQLARDWMNRGEFNRNPLNVDKFMDLFKSKLGNWLLEYKDEASKNDITINNMVASGKRLLVFSNDFGNSKSDVYHKYSVLWEGNKIFNKVFDEGAATHIDKIKKFNTKLEILNKNIDNVDKFSGLSTALTPNEVSILKSFMKIEPSLYTASKFTNETLVNFFLHEEVNWDGVSFVETDFFEDTQVVSILVEHNYTKFV